MVWLLELPFSILGEQCAADCSTLQGYGVDRSCHMSKVEGVNAAVIGFIKAKIVTCDNN